MKHYINPETKEIFAYAADGSQDDYIKPGLQPISDEELAALRAQAEASMIMTCSAYQIREALNQLGWREVVESAIASGNQSLKDAWHYASAFKRDHPKIAEMAQAIGKTDADIDALFNLAVTLVP